MDTLAYTAPWVLGSVCVGVIAGYYLGKSRVSKAAAEEQLDGERQVVLKAMVDLLQSAERMTSDVATHNSEIQETAHRVSELDTSDEMRGVKDTLIGHMESLIRSNHELQKDLTYSRYQIDEQAQQIDQARREARTDTLTAVGNRKAFDEKLHCLLVDWERDAVPFVLVLIDLDYFKRINDAHGHQAGDEVLARVGNGLNERAPEGAFVGRYGGDEFAVLLPGTDVEAGLDFAETVRSWTDERASRVAVRDGEVSISLSIGVTAAQSGDSVESILGRADRGLYTSKRRGRNQVNVGRPDDDPPAGEDVPLAIVTSADIPTDSPGQPETV